MKYGATVAVSEAQLLALPGSWCEGHFQIQRLTMTTLLPLYSSPSQIETGQSRKIKF